MHADTPGQSKTLANDADWLRHLGQLLPDEELVPNAARGTADPLWEQRRAASYPDRLVLGTLSAEDELRAALPRAGIAPGMDVLDAGCGPGIVSRWLCDAGARVVGYDINRTMLELAERLPTKPQQQLAFRRGSLLEPLPFADASFARLCTFLVNSRPPVRAW